MLVLTLFSLLRKPRIFCLKSLEMWFRNYFLNGCCVSVPLTCTLTSPKQQCRMFCIFNWALNTAWPCRPCWSLLPFGNLYVCMSYSHSSISYALPVLIVCKGLSRLCNKPRRAPYLLCLLWMLRSMCSCISNNLAPKQMSIYFSQLPLIITILNLVVYKMDGLLIQFTKIVH